MTIGSIAQLGIEINSDSARTASDQLDRLVQSGSRTNQELAALNLKQQYAARSMNEMAQSAAKAAQELQSLNLKQSYSAQALNDLVTSSGQAVTELRQLTSQQAASAQQMEGLRSAVLSSASAFQAATASLQGFMAQNQQIAAASTKAATGIKAEKDELSKLLGQIDPTVAALGRLDEMERKLQSYRAKGLIDADTFTDYKTKLDQARESTGRLGDTMQRTGVSAKQTAAAMRGLPAQFTDIVVSLQGGQAPLTVLLQQGGQIKDMFGGIGPAAKAMGGFVLGMVNPLTVAAAAVGVLSAAMLASQSQFNEYNKAVVSTGGVAGKTADQLSALASTLANGKNFSEASAAVLTLTQNGRLTGDVFREVARAATEMAVATGQSAADIANQLSSTKGKVTDLAVEYSDKYGVITQATYEQIRALEDQGDRMGAIKVLSQSLADEMTRRNKEMEDSTRGLAKAWAEVQKSVSSTWNQIKTGLQASPELFRLQFLQGQLQDAKDLGDKKLIAYYEEQVAAAQKAFDLQQKKVALVGQEEAGRRAQISAEDKWQTDSLKYLTAKQKMEKEIADARIQGLNAGRSQTDIDQRVGDIRKSYEKKIAGPAGQVDLTAFNDQQNALKALVSDYANSQKELESQQKAGIISAQDYYTQRTALIRAEKEQVTEAYQAEIAALEQARDKSTTTGAQRIQLDQKIADARAAMVKAQKDADSQLRVLADNEKLRTDRQTAAVKAYTDALQQQVETLRQQGSRAALSLGMGDRQKSLYDSQNSIDDRINQQKLDLANQYGDGSRGMSLEEYQQKLAALNKTQQDLRDTVVSNYDAMTAAQGNWAAGASSAWANYQENALNVAGQTKSAFTSLFDGLTDATVDFAFGADESFGDVAVSFAKMLAKMAVQAAASSVFSSIAGSLFTSTASAGVGAGASAGASASSASLGSFFANGLSTGGYTGDGGKYEPKGIVHGGEVVIRKEVVSQPGMKDYLLGINARGYADGGYVGSTTAPMVSRQSSGGSTIGNLEININRDGTSSVDADTELGKGLGDDILKLIDSRIKQNEAKSLSSQGNIRMAINGRRK